MSTRDLEIRSNSAMTSQAMDYTETGMAFDLKMQPIKESIDSLQEIMKVTPSKLQEKTAVSLILGSWILC